LGGRIRIKMISEMGDRRWEMVLGKRIRIRMKMKKIPQIGGKKPTNNPAA